MQMNEMPSIGTTLTYGEAIKAYDRFERTMLEKAYGAELLPAVGCTTCFSSLSRSRRSLESRVGASRGSRGRSGRSRARGPPLRMGKRREVLPATG